MTAKPFLFAFTNNLVFFSFSSQLFVVYQPVRNFSRCSNRPPVWNREGGMLVFSQLGAWWNDTDWGETGYSGTCSYGTLSITNPAFADLGLNTFLAVRGRRLTAWDLTRPECCWWSQCFRTCHYDNDESALLPIPEMLRSGRSRIRRVFSALWELPHHGVALPCRHVPWLLAQGVRTVLILDYAMYSLHNTNPERNFSIFRNFVDLRSDPRGHVVQGVGLRQLDC